MAKDKQSTDEMIKHHHTIHYDIVLKLVLASASAICKQKFVYI